MIGRLWTTAMAIGGGSPASPHGLSPERVACAEVPAGASTRRPWDGHGQPLHSEGAKGFAPPRLFVSGRFVPWHCLGSAMCPMACGMAVSMCLVTPPQRVAPAHTSPRERLRQPQEIGFWQSVECHMPPHAVKALFRRAAGETYRQRPAHTQPFTAFEDPCGPCTSAFFVCVLFDTKATGAILVPEKGCVRRS